MTINAVINVDFGRKLRFTNDADGVKENALEIIFAIWNFDRTRMDGFGPLELDLQSNVIVATVLHGELEIAKFSEIDLCQYSAQ